MGRRKIYSAAAVLVLVACLVIPAFASAKPSYAAQTGFSPSHYLTARRGDFVTAPSRTSEAHLHGTNGYAITLFGSRSSVYLSVAGHHASVQYMARGRVTQHLIKARFGQLGRVSVRFRPKEKRRIPPQADNCEGDGELIESGSFVGTIGFVGENRYTTVHAHRADGTVTYRTKERCRQSNEKGGPPIRFTILRAEAKDGGTNFTAFKVGSTSRSIQDQSSFAASVFEWHGHTSIFRTIYGNADEDAFTDTRAHGKLVEATVEPPAPFSGSATYVGNASTPSENWTGDLAGEFPGIGEVSLTGPDFCADTELLVGCERSSGHLIGVVLGR